MLVSSVRFIGAIFHKCATAADLKKNVFSRARKTAREISSCHISDGSAFQIVCPSALNERSLILLFVLGVVSTCVSFDFSPLGLDLSHISYVFILISPYAIIPSVPVYHLTIGVHEFLGVAART